MAKALTCLVFVLVVPMRCLVAQTDSTIESQLFAHQDYFNALKEEKRMFKVNILEWIRRIDQEQVSGVIYIGYEQKIKSFWSLNMELSSEYSVGANERGKTSFELKGNNLLSLVQPRYYYSLRRRIKEGISANNLSANYVGLAFFSNLSRMRNLGPNPEVRSVYNLQDVALAPVWGIQRRILNKGYFDFALGLKFTYGDGERALYVFQGKRNVWGIAPLTQVKLGIGL